MRETASFLTLDGSPSSAKPLSAARAGRFGDEMEPSSIRSTCKTASTYALLHLGGRPVSVTGADLWHQNLDALEGHRIA